MKKLSTLFEAKQNLDIQEDSLNYVSVADLQKYLKICDKFLSPEGKEVCQWLIDNNSSYMKKFGGENALATFYNAGVPKDAELKPLYRAIGILNKKNRLLEIPVFQNDEQFNSIIDKKVSPDEILLDLTTEKGRNEIAKKYNALVWKIARSFNGKSNLSLEELYSAGLEGLSSAMNTYGKRQKKGETEEEVEAATQKIKQLTFFTHAAAWIRQHILGAIASESHLVRIPLSAQKKERDEKGANTKSNSVSGDETVGHDKEGNSKSLFDYMSDAESGHKSVDSEDFEDILKDLYKIIDSKFNERDREIFYLANGVNGREKMKKGEIAAKYNMAQSNVSAILAKVISYILSDKKAKELALDAYELLAEGRVTPESTPMGQQEHHIAENLRVL